MYVGVSSGAMIAAGLVNGYDTTDMGVVFIHNASLEYPVRRDCSCARPSASTCAASRAFRASSSTS